MQSFKQFWDNLDESNAGQFGEFVKEHLTEVAATIVKEILEQDEVEIGIGYQESEHFALIAVEPGNMDKELSLRYFRDGSYKLYFSFYDEEGMLQSLTQSIKSDQISIPSGLEILMKECLETESSKTIRKNEIK